MILRSYRVYSIQKEARKTNLMSDLLQPVIDTVSQWDGITAASHRFGGTEFNLGKVEVGHVHRGGMVDIPYTRKLRDALIETGAAEPHHLLDESGWISFYVRSPRDVEAAIRLFRLSYLHKRGRRDATLDADTYAQELTTLGFADAVTSAMPAMR